MKKLNFYRHGDVSLHGIGNLPDNLREIDVPSDGFILAMGEVTNHSHRLIGTGFQVFQDDQGRNYVVVQKPTDLTHQEHKTITLAPGIYRQGAEQEHDYFSNATRRVID